MLLCLFEEGRRAAAPDILTPMSSIRKDIVAHLWESFGMRWNNATQTVQIMFGLRVSTWREKGRRKTGGKGREEISQRVGGRGKGRSKVEEKVRKAMGKLPGWGQNGRKRWPCVSGCLSWVQERLRGKGRLSSGLGMEGIVFSAPRPHPYPARTVLDILPERLIRADLRGGTTKRCIEVRTLASTPRGKSPIGEWGVGMRVRGHVALAGPP